MSKGKTGGLGRGLGSLISDTYFSPQPVELEEGGEQDQLSEEARIIESIRNLSANPPKREAQEGSQTAGSAAAAQSAGDASERVIYVKLSDIKPNSMQPRKVFSEEALLELADSIMEHGVIQPVLLRPAKGGYELVAGERRWRAARKAGLKAIPAIIRNLDDRQNAFYALIENMQREDLNSIEEAQGIQRMIEEYGLTQEEAAKAVGKSRPYISNALRLLKLPEAVQELVLSGALSAGHARAIAGLSSEKLQLEAAEKAVKEGWSVRKIESYAGSRPQKKGRKKRTAKSADIKRIEEQLSESLGTKIAIKGSEAKGQIILDYYSRDELERLIELLRE